MSRRKLWGTKWAAFPGNEMSRFESRAAVYRFADAQRANWACGVLRSPNLNVYVDERDGRGWQLYERIDLSEDSEHGQAVPGSPAGAAGVGVRPHGRPDRGVRADSASLAKALRELLDAYESGNPVQFAHCCGRARAVLAEYDRVVGGESR